MTHPPLTDDPRVVQALGASVVVRLVSGMLRALWSAAAASASGAWIGRGRGVWLAQSTADRRRSMGVALIVAALTHVVLLVTHEAPPGWLWVTPPALAAMVGGLCVLSAAERSDR